MALLSFEIIGYWLFSVTESMTRCSSYSLVLGFVVLDLVVRDARLGRRQLLPRPRRIAADELDAAVRRQARVRMRGRHGGPDIVVAVDLVETLAAGKVVEALARGRCHKPPLGRRRRVGRGGGGGVVGAHQEDQHAEEEACRS